MKFKMQYGIEDDVLIEGSTWQEVFENAEKELSERGWKRYYQGMKLDKTMLIKIEN